MRIFICGPYSGSVEEARRNVCRAMDVATALMRLGHEPFVPHLSHVLHLHQVERGEDFLYERCMQWTMAWLEQCDALYFIDHSPGSDRELARARELKIPIYLNLAEVLDAR